MADKLSALSDDRTFILDEDYRPNFSEASLPDSPFKAEEPGGSKILESMILQGVN